MAISIERRLPEELLTNIISLAAHDALPNLCLASTTFNRLTTPHLYSSITVETVGGVRLLRFAYTIFTSPKHASLVKSLIIPDDIRVLELQRTYDDWPAPRPGFSDLENLLKDKCAVYAVNDKQVDEMYCKVKSGTNGDALLALLLAYLPNVQRLDFSFIVGEKHDDFITMLELIMNRVKSIDQLHHPQPDATKQKVSASSTTFLKPVNVMVTGTSDSPPHNPSTMAGFFNLPNLHALYAWRMGDSERDPAEDVQNTFARLKPRSCHVEYIELRTSKLHKLNLQCLMNATIPNKLKTFNYEIGCAWAWCNVEHLAIMKSLEAHHNTLESLGLSHEDFYPFQYEDSGDKPYSVSFKPFKVLKRLKVAPVYIWGHERFTNKDMLTRQDTKEMLYKALPDSIEELWITRAESQISNRDGTIVHFIPDCLLPALELVIQEKLQSFPKLSHLRIEFPLMQWESAWLDALGSICRRADANGICAVVILVKLPNYSDNYGFCVEVERAWGWNEDVHWQKCLHNKESPKRWISVAKEQDLGQMLKDLKAKLAEERYVFEAASKARTRWLDDIH